MVLPECYRTRAESLRKNFPQLVEKIEWMIGLTDFKVDGLIDRNKWLTEYAKAHPDDWRWKDSKYAHTKDWIPGQIEMEEIE